MIIIINGAILIFITNYCSNTFSISYSYLMTIVQDNTLVVIMHISGLLHSCVCLLVEKKIVLSLGVIALHRNENFVAVFAPVQISVPSSSSSRSNVGFGIFPIKNGSWKDTTGTTATNVSAFAVKTLGNVRGICTTVDSFNFPTCHQSPPVNRSICPTLYILPVHIKIHQK